MSFTYPTLTGDRSQDTAAVVALFAGQAPVVTDSAPALAAIAQYEVCVLLTTGVTPYVPATHTTAAPDKLVVAQVAVASGAQAPYWTHGKFNHNALIWPAALSTYALRKEAVAGGGIQVGHAKPPSA